ncbi:GNAT family N-acetyltransferase [Lacticaseibacillus chiayiensis]|uniref:GNAT family N-acetyltransferase n=1 Tax=Lacticaseibacillus chiayiensis TaxID=2100821 RepID=UPI003C72A70C
MSIENEIAIAREDDPEKKQRIVRHVLADLPEWFGLPESTKSYVQESAKLPLWVACYHSQTIGFIDYFQTSIATGEIRCMSVRKQFHQRGIGTRLEQSLESYAKKHAHYLQVKTVDEGHYPEYDKTIHFYDSLGFERLEVFPTLWDAWNPCLVMIKKL